MRKKTNNMKDQFLFKPCTLEEAFAISPWPARLSGKEKWEKKDRNIKDILAEYDKYWYGKLIRDWKKFSSKLLRNPQMFDVLHFYNLQEKKINEEVEKNKKIYRSAINNYLISASDQLYAANLYAATVMLYWLMDNEVEKVLKHTKCNAVVELGSGTGKHIFRLFANLNLKEAVGGEICPNAVKLGNRIAKESKINVSFNSFNFYDTNSYKKLVGNLKNYIVYTSHAIEQIPNLGDNLVASLLKLPNPPKAVIHFEPVIFPGEVGFNEHCLQYATINKYNTDLWAVLEVFQKAKKIEILKTTRRILGLTAFNPTSIIIWKIKDA